MESFGSITGYYIGYKILGSDKPYTFKTIEINNMNHVLNLPSSMSSSMSMTSMTSGHASNFINNKFDNSGNGGGKFETIITNLKKSTMYTFSVQAFNSKGAGPSSSEVTGKTLDKDPPSPPRLRIVSTTATSVSLSWTLPDDSSPVNGKNFSKVLELSSSKLEFETRTLSLWG